MAKAGIKKIATGVWDKVKNPVETYASMHQEATWAAQDVKAIGSKMFSPVKRVTAKGGKIAMLTTLLVAAPLALMAVVGNSRSGRAKAGEDALQDMAADNAAAATAATDDLPKVLDFSRDAEEAKRRSVMGEHTARYLGQSSGRNFLPPNTVNGDGASLIDGKTVKDLGGIPSLGLN
jgi:hypothetical protein